ncbi:hypothetical protein ACIQXA_18645 [Streptomyces massasporeus]|uniref:hypothetical protein n=1 Tax=Streptomyces massasporeus TaxID=67324 RepID=UPI003818589C
MHLLVDRVDLVELRREPAAYKWRIIHTIQLPGRRAPRATATGQADVVRHVKEAWESKDIAALVRLLAPAAGMTAADGGGNVASCARSRAARIAPYLVAIADKAPGLELLERSVNGMPGLVAQRAGAVIDRGRVRGHRRPCHPHLGGPEPGETPAVGPGVRKPVTDLRAEATR